MFVDVINEIYTKIKTELSPITVLQSYPNTAPQFPCVILDEIGNNIDVTTVATNGNNHQIITLEVNIFSAIPNYNSEIRPLRSQVDEILSTNYGLHRDTGYYTPNIGDDSITRYTMRYNFRIDKNKTIYRGN